MRTNNRRNDAAPFELMRPGCGLVHSARNCSLCSVIHGFLQGNCSSRHSFKIGDALPLQDPDRWLLIATAPSRSADLLGIPAELRIRLRSLHHITWSHMS